MRSSRTSSIVAVRVEPSRAPQTFMKIGPRNAMVISVCSLALHVDRTGARCVRRSGPRRRPCGSSLPASTSSTPSRRSSRLRRARSTMSAERPPTGGTPSVCSPNERSSGACVHGRGATVKIALTVNGEARETEAWGGESLLFVLRERLGLPGSKNACEQGECGSCSVLLDGTLVCACLVLGAQADGHEVTTVEGLADGDRLHAVQEAYIETGAVQCGFCTPGSRRRDRRSARVESVAER